MRKLDSFLGLVAPAMFLWLGAILIAKRLHREYPFFFIYVLAVIVIAPLRFIVAPNYALFFWVFWVTECLYALLAVLALHEAFRAVFREFYDVWAWFKFLFPTVVCLGTLWEVWDTIRKSPDQLLNIQAVILSFAMTVNWTQIVLFGLMCFLAWVVGNWEYYPLGIVVGFALSALGSWASYAAFSIFGTKFTLVGKYGPPLAYFLAALVWLITFYRPVTPKQWDRWNKTISPEQMLEEVESYLKILKGPFKKV